MNRFYAKGAMKQGLGSVSKATIKRPGTTTPAASTLPMGTASWPGLPGKTQSKSRSGSTPTAGPLGSFTVKKAGL